MIEYTDIVLQSHAPEIYIMLFTNVMSIRLIKIFMLSHGFCGSEIWSSLAEQFQLRVSQKTAVKNVGQHCSPPKARPPLEEPLGRWLPLSAGRLMLAAGWRPLCHICPPIGLLEYAPSTASCFQKGTAETLGKISQSPKGYLPTTKIMLNDKLLEAFPLK